MDITKPLQGKLALVTGAGRRAGIGAAICRELAKSGSDIFLTDWHPLGKETLGDHRSGQETLAEEFRQFGIRVGTIDMDLSASNSAEKIFRAVESELGAPDILVNNACHDFEVPFLELTPEILDEHYAVNVRAVTMLCKEFVKIGKPGQSLGSMGGHKLPYTITKAALEMLSKQLAPELIKHGVTINAIDPGPTDTGWMTEELKEQIRRNSKRGKVNTPEDVGRLIVSILTQQKKVTGEVIHAER